MDQDDKVLDILGQSRRHTQAAQQFCRQLLQGLPYVPRVIITAKWKSSGAAQRERLPGVEQRQSRSLTNRCEADGIDAAQKAIDLDRRLGLLDHLAVPLIVLGQIYQCHGEHAQALVCYEEALAHAEKVGEPQLLFPCYDGLATIYLDVGDQVRAEIYLARSQEVCERAGLDPDGLTILPFLC